MNDKNILQLGSFFKIPPIQSYKLLAGGANNRVYKLEFTDREPLILKQYFQHPQDTRQRLQSEFFFLKYCRDLGLNCVPQPIEAQEPINAAIYSFLQGRQLTTNEISESLIQQVIDFFLAINQRSPELPLASESCFSLQEHLDTVERRIEYLSTSNDPRIKCFLEDRLLPHWEKIKCDIPHKSSILSRAEQCVSPSDFGLHNALIQENGRLAFIDFEYAGWDDPAKTVCDFFCQPRIPIPFHFFELISAQFSSISDSQLTLQRIQWLLPVYQIKWCCIILNSFSKTGQTRRTFALSNESLEEQIIKAQHLLNQEISWPI
jgi:thiamine kinase-like enzyme